MRKKIVIIIIILLGLLFIIGIKSSTNINDNTKIRPLQNHNFDPIETIAIENRYITYTDFRDNILYDIAPNVIAEDNYTDVRALFETALDCNASGEECKTIRIDSALELFNFSIDVSYNRNKIEDTRFFDNIVQVLLSLNYALGMDIDYSTMGAHQFMPIGYNFISTIDGKHEAVFTGVFDGRGFEISNLYAAGYDYLIVTEGEDTAAEDIPLSNFYSMFTENKGTIKNLGLVNPTFEIRTVHDNILWASNLVGSNHDNGVVNKVYVIDNREDVLSAGIRMRTPIGASDSKYRAAGIVYSNTGSATFSEAYFASRLVVNGSYINNFDVQPVLYENTGNISKLVYDSTKYLNVVKVESSSYTVTTPNSFANPEEEQVLKSNSSLGSDKWYYYPDYRYPTVLGLDIDTDGKYKIKDAVDFIAFSKMINFVPHDEDDEKYYNLDYKMTNHIDFSQVAKGAYKTPQTKFGGSLTGISGEDKNYYIINLELVNGINLETEYLGGLFSVVTGSVSNITLNNFKIKIEDAENYYSSKFYIGSVAGKSSGEINNVSVNIDIDLGTDSIGEYAVGGIVGEASGTVQGVFTVGNLKNNLRTFNETYDIDPIYYIGGVVGKTGDSKLTLYNALNEVDILGIGTLEQINTTASSVEIYTGGVLGYVNNTKLARHNLGFITNKAEININNYKSAKPVNQYVAGVVGYSTGVNYDYDINSGQWTNTNIEIENLNDEANIIINETTNTIHSAGVVISNHSENVEFLYLFNHTTFSTSSYSNFNYTSLVYDIGTGGVTLSQSTNYGNYEINGNYNFSGVFLSKNNSQSLLRFVENRGDIIYKNQVISSERLIAGITLSNNIDFLNVYFSGNILVHNTESTYPLWVSGIAKELSAGRFMINSMTRGRDIIQVPDEENPEQFKDELIPSKIIVANHNTGTSKSAHIYVGGLVNINLSGDLHIYDDFENPKANIGIINSINYANISTSLNQSTYGVQGSGNFFAGGITTFNAGSIQDTANMGDVKIYNLTEETRTPEVQFYSTTDDGGRVEYYYGSVIIGGVASCVTIGNSRIYDSTNSGDVIAISTNLTRSGGVLGISLLEELSAGNVPASIVWNDYTNNSTNNKRIENSILSNCINYGTVSSITKSVILYSISTDVNNANWDFYFFQGDIGDTSPYSVKKDHTTTVGTYERIGIYSASGGIIGYGLCVMRRMLNHGDVSSTDVAGGIVGATFAGLGARGTTTTVKINTALNYGYIRAINHENFSQVSSIIDITYNDLCEHFYETDADFIKPKNLTNEQLRTLPGGKRGIGGIFGRLQRGDSRYMSSEDGSFNYIINMDPNVDLIGRLDQVIRYTNSNRYFIFRNAKYFSANPNDTTQAAFTGYYYFYNTNNSASMSNVATRTIKTYDVITKREFEYIQNGSSVIEKLSVYKARWEEKEITGNLHIANGGQLVDNKTNTILLDERNVLSENVEVTERIVPQKLENKIEYVLEKTQVGNTLTENIPSEFTYRPSSFSNTRRHTSNIKATRVPYITEIDGEEISSVWPGKYVYDENFEMRKNAEFSKYIYFVDNEVLSNRFKSIRTHGMYVLSTSSGSAVGSTLPANVDLTKLYPIKGLLAYNGDYLNPERQDLELSIISEYNSLLQTEYNDKSTLLDNNGISLIEVDSEGIIGGAMTKLITPTIDQVNRRITFQLNLKQVVGFDILYYQVSNADLPINAKIGPKLVTGVNPEDSPDLILANPSSNSGTVYIGTFTSYSEAAREVPTFRNIKYTTDYEVYINIIPISGNESPKPYQYRLEDSGDYVSYTNYNPIPTKVEKTIEIVFQDLENVLPSGADIYEYISMWYTGLNGTDEEIEVLTKYYQLSTTCVSNPGRLFSLKIVLLDDSNNNNLRKGYYKIKFRYFPKDNVDGKDREIIFQKKASNDNKIISLSHYSSGIIEPSSATIKSRINFGYPIDQLKDTPTFEEHINYSIDSYLNNTLYTIPSLTSISISPFSSVVGASLYSKTYNMGYITYTYMYIIKSESGVESPYTHEITEREIDIVNYYKNNNKVVGDNLFATREAESTKFSFDFGIDSSYSNLIYNYFTDNDIINTDIYFEVSNIIPGVTITTDSYLDLYMDQSVVTGVYDFSITLVRVDQSIEYKMEFNSVYIEKKPGVNAHLLDIRFSQTVQDTSYPIINVAYFDGRINYDSQYKPRMYYAGIDYNRSNFDSSVIHYRIAGEVANTPLNEYVPYFLEYLPPGAKISRLHYTSVTESYWTTPVDKYSNLNDINELSTDFTVYPDTKLEYGEEDRGNDGIEDDNILITYKVINEIGNKEIYYHISVIDIVYNVSMIFTINYHSSASNLKNKPVLINVKNIVTNLPVGEDVLNNPELFPQFSSVSGINNNINLFYLYNEYGYKFRFGRNMSGFYIINVVLPETEEGLVYSYKVEYSVRNDLVYELEDMNDRVPGTKGKYYYINYGEKNRTRNFTITIYKTTGINPSSWGLNNKYYSWQ